MNAKQLTVDRLGKGLSSVADSVVGYIDKRREERQKQATWDTILQMNADDPNTVNNLSQARISGVDPLTAMKLHEQYRKKVDLFNAGDRGVFKATTTPSGDVSVDPTPVIPGENKPTHYDTEVDPTDGKTKNTAYFADGSKKYLGTAEQKQPTLYPMQGPTPGSVVYGYQTRDAAGNPTLKATDQPMVPKPDNQAGDMSGLDQKGLDLVANTYLTHGVIPSFGKDNRMRARFWNRAAELNDAAGGAPNQPALNKVDYDTKKAALTGVEKILSGTRAAADNAKRNMGILRDKLSALDASSFANMKSALLNDIKNYAVGKAVAHPELTAYTTAMYPVVREYAKVSSGMALSAQGLTDSATKEAENLLNRSQSPQDVLAALDVMVQDMDSITKGYESESQLRKKEIGDILPSSEGKRGPQVGQKKSTGEVWNGKEWAKPKFKILKVE